MQLGPYVIEREVGRGAAGVVYRGRAPDGAAVAVKVLLQARPETLARFEREKRLLSELREEDGFVPLLDAGRIDARAWLAMPFVGGGTLRDRLRARTRLEVDETRALGVALAEALGRAHARGIVHRDVKPENVLFDASGRPLLGDLGIAKHFSGGSDASAALSKTGQLRGTPHYVAPEQAQDSSRATPAADVYALAAVLYECLAGAPPITADTFLEVLSRKARGSFEPLARARPGVPAGLAAAIERALDPDPARRPADGGALARDLSSGSVERRASGGWRPGRGRLVLGAAVAAAAVACVAVAGVALGRRGGGAQPPAPPSSANPSLDDAIAQRPDDVALRRERVLSRARAKRPLDAEDLVRAAPALSPGELDEVVARLAEPGVEGPRRRDALAALRARAPSRSELALAHGVLLLEEGDRDEARAALKLAARSPSYAAGLVRALDAVDRFVLELDRTNVLAQDAILPEASRAAEVLETASIPISARALSGTIAPLVSRVRRLAVAPRLEDRVRGPSFAALERIFERIAERIPDEDFATYEAGCYQRRPTVDPAGGEEAHRILAKRRVKARLEAALPGLLRRDPALGIEVGLVIVDVRVRFDPRSSEFEAHFRQFEELERACPDARSRARVAVFLGERTRGVALADERPARARWFERALALVTRAHESISPEVPLEVSLPLAVERARQLVALGRLDEADAILAGLGSGDGLAVRAELQRRHGDLTSAVALAREALDRPEGFLPGPDVLSSRATLALASAALGDEETMRQQLEAYTRSDNGLFELTVREVVQAAEELLAASRRR